MAEEFMSESLVFMRALNDTRDIGDGDPAVFPEIDNPDDGMEGGERVWSGLRMGCRDGAEESGFTGIRISDKPDVGDRAEFQIKPRLLA